MFTITVLLLALGAVLALLGTLGFVCVWQAPSHEELRATRGAATIGRWMATAGLLMYIPSHTASGIGLAALLLTALVAAASRLTRYRSRIIQPT